MKLSKICKQCRNSFDNKRKKGGLLGKIQFSKRLFCSHKCRAEFDFKPNLIRLEGNVIFLLLENKNVETLIDSEDYEKIKNNRWYQGSLGYAECHPRNESQRVLRLHEAILPKTSVGQDTDHINRNRLDNRRSNLRLISHQENILNSKYGDLPIFTKKCLGCRRLFNNRYLWKGRIRPLRIPDKEFRERKFCSRICSEMATCFKKGETYNKTRKMKTKVEL